MFLKIFLCCLAASLTLADNSIDSTVIPPEVRVESSVSFETAHKRPESLGDDGFQTSHKINNYDMENMNLLPTKEKPELNPVLSALINEDVMKSIEAKRAIEKAELEIIKAEVDAAVKAEEKKIENEREAKEKEEKSTETPLNVLTTAVPIKKGELEKDDDINVGFVDQAIALDTAGTENNKKSRIEIKKGPNGQDYEYEYVYYYEDEEEDAKPKGTVAEDGEEAETRGKSRYTNIERSTPASPADNSLVSGKAKGRSSNVDESIETERLPQNTRFPSRGKTVDVPPTPALDSVDSAAEKKKISVKRPSLELVDSQTFNTDEKLSKSSRNSDDTKSAITIEQETAALASAQAAAAAAKTAEEAEAAKAINASADTDVDPDEDVAQTTPAMEKAALDLYALLTNENNNMDMTTDASSDITTIVPDTTDGDDLLTTVVEEEPSSTTTTTTTTTTPEPTTTTTTTTTTTPAPSLYGGRRTGAGSSTGRNRFKLKSGNSLSTTTTTEAPAEAPKTGKNRFSRPSIGGRARPGAKTTAAPPSEEPHQEEEVSVKEAKPVSSGFSRNRPRNRFNLRGSTTTTEASAQDSNDHEHEEGAVSTTARSLRGRPTLNIRGRSRTTTTKSPATEEEAVNDSDNSVDDKPNTPAPSHSGPVRPSRFNLNRAAGGRLPGRAKLGRPTTEAPAAAENEDSAADSSHHNDVKGSEGEEAAEKPAEEPASVNVGGLNRLKNRPRLGGLQKTETKPKVAPAPLAPRKVNPLLANRRLKVGPSTTEAAPVEEAPADTAEESEAKEETSDAANEEAKEETTEETETTTKQQARGLGLLGQRRRLPLRKPGTLL